MRLEVPNRSGEALLLALSNFLIAEGPGLHAGRVRLTLQPRALEYVVARLEVVEELERLKDMSPVDFFRGCGSDVYDYKRLENIHHHLQKLRSLCVASSSRRLRDPTRINLSVFSSLTTLELRGCDLSTSACVGLDALRPTLVDLLCFDSLEELQHLLAPCGEPDTLSGSFAPHKWPQLTNLKCTHNCFSVMDASLSLLPGLKSLDLSFNNIGVLESLEACRELTHLNLANNSLCSVTNLRGFCGSLRHIQLQGNNLASLEGLEALTSLERLDLRGNLLASFREVVRISGLGALQDLWLADNPLALARLYRIDVLACFPNQPRLLLDGQPARRPELDAAALRAEGGRVPEGWRVTLRFLEQRGHFWPWDAADEARIGAALAAPHLRAPVTPEDGAAGTAPLGPPSLERHTRRQPARRIVEFSPAGQCEHSSPDGGWEARAQGTPPGSMPRGPPYVLRPLRSRRRLTDSFPACAGGQGGGARYFSAGQNQEFLAASPPKFEHAVLERLRKEIAARQVAAQAQAVNAMPLQSAASSKSSSSDKSLASSLDSAGAGQPLTPLEPATVSSILIADH